ncbi:MAG: hypothetical protein ACRD4J_11020 [Nitrososphaeraceae archaeon]
MSKHISGFFFLSLVLCFISLIGAQDSYLALADMTEHSISIHGGGLGTITCPIGSSVDTNLSFIANSFSNGTIVGNWTLYSFNSNSFNTNSLGSIVQGPVYSGNISLSSYVLEGETVDRQDRIFLCNPPLFGPLTITGTCGRNIDIAVEFQTADPFETAESFSGSAECQETI